MFKGQSTKICLQRLSPGLSVSHSQSLKGQRQLPEPPSCRAHFLVSSCSTETHGVQEWQEEARISSGRGAGDREGTVGIPLTYRDPKWGFSCSPHSSPPESRACRDGRVAAGLLGGGGRVFFGFHPVMKNVCIYLQVSGCKNLLDFAY